MAKKQKKNTYNQIAQKLFINFLFLFRAIQRDGQSHAKFSRPSETRLINIDDLDENKQYQFWVTAVTAVGEGMSSNVVTQKPSHTGQFRFQIQYYI